MTIRIPDTIFDGLVKWMVRGPWPEYFQEAIDDHLHVYCDQYDLDTFDELAEKIGQHWVTTLNDIAMNDFLSRETEDGNVVDLYLKRRGWKEKAIPKAYLRAIRASVMSIYEVSDIKPGKSFMARDLFLGGDPIRVEEKSGTKTMLPWEHFAMRIVEVRGCWRIAGGVLPYKPELSEQVIEDIKMRVDEIEVGLKEMLNEDEEYPEPEIAQNLFLMMVLKMSAPLFSEAWLAGNTLDPNDIELPTLLNAEGDEIEFIKLHYKFAKGTTQKQLCSILDAAEDMEPASSKIWNWFTQERGKPGMGPQHTKGVMYKSELENGALVLGMIELCGKTLEANVNSAERADQLTERLQILLGGLVAPPIMVRQTVEQAMAEHKEKPAPSEQLDLPPDVESQMMKKIYDQHYRDTLDQQIPMLDNQSPREAVKTLEGRNKVVAWLKIMETGEAKNSRSKGIDAYDFTWIWQELGILDLRC